MIREYTDNDYNIVNVLGREISLNYKFNLNSVSKCFVYEKEDNTYIYEDYKYYFSEYEETKEEIKSFYIKALVVVFGIFILASVAYVCNMEKETNSEKVLNDIVYDDSTNVPPVIREITRPNECDTKTAFKAWASIKDKKEFANCWYDSFSYDGVVENKVSIMWIVCPRNTKMIYGYVCKWIDYSEVKTNE